MTRRLSLLFLIVLLFSACSLYKVSSEDITSDYYPSKQNINDVAYMETVSKPHETIGYVTVNAERNQRLSEVIEKMKREAAILGGDAITNIKTDASGVWKSLPAQELIGNAYVRANFSASVIVFK